MEHIRHMAGHMSVEYGPFSFLALEQLMLTLLYSEQTGGSRSLLRKPSITRGIEIIGLQSPHPLDCNSIKVNLAQIGALHSGIQAIRIIVRLLSLVTENFISHFFM